MEQTLLERVKAGNTITVTLAPVGERHRTEMANPTASIYSPRNAFTRNYRGLRGNEARAIRARIAAEAEA